MRVIFHSNLDEVQFDLYQINNVWKTEIPNKGDRIEFKFGKMSYELEVYSISYLFDLERRVLTIVKIELHIPSTFSSCMTIEEWTKWFKKHRESF